MTYREAIQFLSGLQLFGSQFGLERTRRLARLAGNPEDRLRFVHVAGTNGKGSTCAMLEAIYRKAGWRTGLYTSPHLVTFRERMQINRELIAEADLARITGMLRGWLDGMEQHDCPTFFEAATVLALVYFAENKCDVVIWETGLGGRLDATNIVVPLASVITNVQFDHEKWLGSTLADIAREKAGIIKPRVPVITGATGESLDVIRETARSLTSPLHEVREPYAEAVGLPGEHQRMNAAVAARTVETISGALSVSSTAIQSGLKDAPWPGRFQVLRRGEQTIVLDGAHNPAGAAALLAALDAEFGNVPFTFITGALADKDWTRVIHALARRAGDLICVPVTSARTAEPGLLCAAAAKANPALAPRCASSVGEAFEASRSARHVVITGSLYLVGEALEALGECSVPGERDLNDWTPARSSRDER